MASRVENLQRQPERENGEVDENIAELAASGELGKAARSAVRRQRRKGLPITFQRGNKIIRQRADGGEDVLEIVEPVRYRIPQGVEIVGGR